LARSLAAFRNGSDGWTGRSVIEAAASGLIDDNAMAPVWWKFAQDYIMSHKK